MSIDQLAARATENAARWTAYLADQHDPDREFDTDWRGRAVHLIRWGSLIQAIVHGVEHRTYVCTILGGNGIEPPDISVGAYEDEVAFGPGHPPGS